MANLGYKLSDQTVGNILQRHGIPPAPERKRTTTWADFIRAHMSVLAGTDFFSVEVLTLRGLVTYYVLFCATRGRTRIYQGSWRSGVLPPVHGELILKPLREADRVLGSESANGT